MPKTQTTVRVDEKTYKAARGILDKLGVSYSQAINMFNKMVVLKKGLPFEVKIPTDETIKAVKESLKDINTEVITISDLEEEFEKIRKT